MQEPSNQSDLDETLNVTETHDRSLREAAAVKREKHVDEGGREPMSLWTFGTCAVIILIAGLSLGNAGTLFDYNQTVKPGYVRVGLDEGDSGGPPPKEIIEVLASKGQKVYGKCIGCHGSDGRGGGAYPSLAGSEWATGETERFAMIVLNGLVGPASDGKEYGVMAAQGMGMSDVDLAAVMTYVRNSFGNETGDVVTPEMAAAAMEISQNREDPGSPVNAGELNQSHNQDLPGEPMDPTTMVDPITLEPVEDAG
jgi:mono/diheme cytochrome c family protein